MTTDTASTTDATGAMNTAVASTAVASTAVASTAVASAPGQTMAVRSLTDRPDPTAHLTEEDIAAFGAELDALRESVMASRGSRDAAYIRRVIDVQRKLELGSRAVLLFSLFPPAWFVGTAALAVSKILDNMEIGHNVLHGQWDWMRDPKIHSTTWEWDMASPAKSWQHSHNEIHHTWTNVVGKDHDIGYDVLRMDEDQPWTPWCLPQPLYNLGLALGFEYAIAVYDLQVGSYLHGHKDKAQFRAEARAVGRKIRKQMTKDYVLHPLLSGPSALHTLTANLTANLIRNVWSHSVIFCGHFPEGVETFSKASIEGETRGQWYLRQMIGSANIEGSPLLHLMTGQLSFQIEHHLFPDLPSNRYAEIAPQVRDLCQRYGLSYTIGPLPRQVASAWRKVFRLSLPNGGMQEAVPALRKAARGIGRFGRSVATSR